MRLIIIQFFKNLILVSMLVGGISLVFAPAPYGFLPLFVWETGSLKIALLLLFGFWWANYYTFSHILKLKIFQWDSGPDNFLLFVSIATYRLVLPMGHILFTWWVQVIFTDYLFHTLLEAPWYWILVLGTLLTPVVIPLLDFLIFLPLAVVVAISDAIQQQGQPVEEDSSASWAADDTDRLEPVTESQDQIAEELPSRNNSETPDAAGSEPKSRAGFLSSLFALISLSGFVIVTGQLFHWGFIVNIFPHSASGVVVCFVFAYLSHLTDQRRVQGDWGGKILRSLVKSLPGFAKFSLLMVPLEVLFALNIFMIPFYALSNLPVTGVVALALIPIKALLAYLLGYMFSRLYLRVRPFPCDDSDQFTRFQGVFTVLLAYGVVVGYVSNWQSFQNNLLYHVLVLAPVLMTVGVYHGDKLMQRNAPFVLFLRRFHGFGDRSLLLSLLNVLPTSLSIGFLTSPQNRMVTWDPLLTMWHGKKFGAFWTSLPYYFISRDETWATNVEKLVRKATMVIIDVSKPSESIAHEIHLLRAHDALAKTLFVTETDRQEILDFLRINGIEPHGAEIRFLVIRKSWLRAFPRMAFGFLLLIPTCSIFLEIVGGYLKVGDMLTMVVIVFPVSMVLFFVLFFKRILDKKSEYAIRDFIRAFKYAPT